MATHSSILAWRILQTKRLAGYHPWVTRSQTWQRKHSRLNEVIRVGP